MLGRARTKKSPNAYQARPLKTPTFKVTHCSLAPWARSVVWCRHALFAIVWRAFFFNRNAHGGHMEKTHRTAPWSRHLRPFATGIPYAGPDTSTARPPRHLAAYRCRCVCSRRNLSRSTPNIRCLRELSQTACAAKSIRHNALHKCCRSGAWPMRVAAAGSATMLAG